MSDAATPICLTFDEDQGCVFVGMFQSRRGICRVDEFGTRVLQDITFAPNEHNRHFPWVDAIAQAVHGDELVSVNRNNAELVRVDRRTGTLREAVYLGEAPNGPRSVVVTDGEAVVSYPALGGLVFYAL